MHLQGTHERVYRVGHIACGIGAGAKGFNDAQPRVGNLKARYECAGGIDVDPGAIRNFNKITGTKGTVADLFDYDQYKRYHGSEPPVGWKEMGPDEMRAAFGGYGKPLDVVFCSLPCKGLSSLLSNNKFETPKYQALNELSERSIWLLLEAYKHDPVRIILFENVPRIADRGRPMLDRIQMLLKAYGYAFAESSHDCGEIGGLAQRRKRFLMVARHIDSVPNFLYEPEKKSLRGVGEIIGRLPLPGAAIAGPMHRIPKLKWKTWVRLAFVEAGKDWRSLQGLRVKNGVLADYAIVPTTNRRENNLGVLSWNDTSGTMTTQRSPLQGRFSVADPRSADKWNNGVLGVNNWNEPTGVVPGASRPGNGKHSVADPRKTNSSASIPTYHIVETNEAAPNVIDPRASTGFGGKGKYRVTSIDEPAGTVIGNSTTGMGAYAVADPNPGYGPNTHCNILRVTPFSDTAGTITGSMHPAGGSGCVADPRADCAYDVVGEDKLPGPEDNVIARIVALDQCWHRPFTTLEAAALQSLFDPDIFHQGGMFDLESVSDAEKREWIGNAVPSEAARGMAETIGRTLLLADHGETFTLSANAIWCNPLELALAVNPVQHMPGETLHG